MIPSDAIYGVMVVHPEARAILNFPQGARVAQFLGTDTALQGCSLNLVLYAAHEEGVQQQHRQSMRFFSIS